MELFGVLRDIVVGGIAGYVVATCWESWAHNHILHAKASRREFWAKHRWLFAPFLRGYYRHSVIHHGKTYRQDHITQFRSEQEQHSLDSQLPKDHSNLILRERYGLTVRGPSFMMFVIPMIPIWCAILWLLGVTAAAASIPFLLMPPLLSAAVHPFVHLSNEEAMAKAGPFMRQVLRTRYMRRVIAHHFVHHEQPNCNFNLLLGGDWLFGVSRPPTPQERDEMQRLNL